MTQSSPANAATIDIQPCQGVVGSIRPPGSKSLTNRALVLAALARGTSRLSGVLASEDTQVMIEAWRTLGIDIQGEASSGQLIVHGCGGQLPNSNAQLFVGNSGTTIRFMTAALATCCGQFTLDGIARMRQRPIGDLLAALQQLGASVKSLNHELPDCPPVAIDAQGLKGGRAHVAGNISSQYLSGLMMAAPLAKNPVQLHVEGELVSVPYVKMTAQVMRAFGARLQGPESGPFEIENHGYSATTYAVEPDASAASYFWAMAAITGGRVTVEGLDQHSLQGDMRFCQVLEQMGCRVHYEDGQSTISGGQLRGIDVDMNDISDTVQTLAAVALFADGPTRVRGVAHNRHKETDRIADLARELRKFSPRIDEHPDGLTIWPATQLQPTSATQVETYNDHRMAMSLSLIGLRIAGVQIRNPGCTMKTYPGYWQDMTKLTQA